MYRNILIPLENSPTDETILSHIRRLARVHSSRLILVHVADGFVARAQEELNLADSQEMRDDRAYLQRRQQELAADGFHVTWHLACGDPADQILRMAEQEGCDLIAMATHGHRFLDDLVRGSVASTIRHRTDIPVLMVRAKKS